MHRQNEVTVGELQGDPTYQASFQTALDLMTAEDNIAVGTAIAGHVYNFWQDKTNALGLWRRTSVASYKTEKPVWETILDFDQLAAKEGIKWVFSGASRLYPDFSRCLLSMSPDGGDASEMREFDIESRTFIEGGFRAPASKSGLAGWIRTRSSSRRPSRMLTRPSPVIRAWSSSGSAATRLEEATPIFRGAEAGSCRWRRVSNSTATSVYLFPARTLNFFAFAHVRAAALGREQTFAAAGRHDRYGGLSGSIRLRRTQPMDGAGRDVVQARRSLIRSIWRDGPRRVCSTGRDLVRAGLSRVDQRPGPHPGPAVHKPDGQCARQGSCLRAQGGKLVDEAVALPENGTVGISHAEHFGSSVSFSFTDFLTPEFDHLVGRQWRDAADGEVTAGALRCRARSSPNSFEARSKDGTMIPYFVVSGETSKGRCRRFFYGYGGFEVPLLPGYAGVRGRLWLEKGNAYVQACIRGGGDSARLAPGRRSRATARTASTISPRWQGTSSSEASPRLRRWASRAARMAAC